VLGRRLDRHLLRSILGPFISCLLGLAMLLVIFDLFDRMDECFRLLGSRPQGLLRALLAIGIFYAEQALSFVVGYGGLAALAAAALAVAALARNSELTAMRATGVSLRRAFLPLLLFGALCGAGQLLLAETAVRRLVPAAEEAANAINRRSPSHEIHMETRTRLIVWGPSAAGGEEQLWNERARVYLSAKQTGPNGRTIEGLGLEVWRSDKPVSYYVSAVRAKWRKGDWILEGGRFAEHGEDQGWRPCGRIRCQISPANLEARNLGLDGVGSDKLYALRDDDPAARVELWRRWGLPLVNLTLLLLGLPLAVLGGSRGGKLLPLGMALVLGACYVLAGELGAELARRAALLDLLTRFEGSGFLAAAGGAARLAVDLAMAAPYLVFLALGLVLYCRMDRH